VVERSEGLRDDLLPDSVSRDDGNVILAHESMLPTACDGARPLSGSLRIHNTGARLPCNVPRNSYSQLTRR
jgi:hypothetical protein